MLLGLNSQEQLTEWKDAHGLNINLARRQIPWVGKQQTAGGDQSKTETALYTWADGMLGQQLGD